MTSIFNEPGFWVGALIAVTFTFYVGMASRAAWWRTAAGALGGVTFVAGLQWAWGSGLTAFLAAGLASFGMAIWGETAVSLVESRMRISSRREGSRVATALVPIPVAADMSSSALAPRPRQALAAVQAAAPGLAAPAAAERPARSVPRAKPATPARRVQASATRQSNPSLRAKPVAQPKPETRAKRAARVQPETRVKRAARVQPETRAKRVARVQPETRKKLVARATPRPR